jgi:large exoprotein involved in heme utilization and adhesion
LIFTNGASLSASTNTSNPRAVGGDIDIKLSDIFFPRNNTLITAFANNGIGGNVKLEAPLLISIPSENNDILANAFFGGGGSITIGTQGIFGLQSRTSQTPLSDITASSFVSVQGLINDPIQGLTNLPVATSDASRLVTQQCLADSRGNEFIITGKGGIQANPGDRPTDSSSLYNLGILPDRDPNLTANIQQSSIPDVIIEATGYTVNDKNQVVLVAGTTPTQAKILCP